jgi:hypothetical protein
MTTINIVIEGEDFSEETKRRMEEIFNKAVAAATAERMAVLEEVLIEAAMEEVEEAVKQLREDTYRQWLNDNSVELAKLLKVEKVEQLSEFLISEFLNSYCYIPRSRVNVAVALKEECERLNAKLDKQIFNEVHQQEANNRLAIREALEEVRVAASLTLWKKGELEQLMENVPFTSKEDYKVKAFQVLETMKKPVKRADVLSEEFEAPPKQPRYYDQLVADTVRILG